MSFLRKFKKGEGGKAASSSASTNVEVQDTSAASEERLGLFTLHSLPPDVSDAIDVVAVHGLGGSWNKTWTASNGKLWLRDFLPSQVEEIGFKARTLAFGYDSESFFSKSTSDIDDVAGMLVDYLDALRQSDEEKRRPIVFVAHSLGGVVTKRKAINICHERQSLYGHLLPKVRAIQFFAVPHRGADIAYWGLFVQRLMHYGQLTFRGNDEFLKGLQRNSKIFASISQQFIERAQALRIVTFVESERLGNQLIVERNSAELMLPNEKVVTIPGTDHRTICKFDAATSQKYVLVWSNFRNIAREPLQKDSIVTANLGTTESISVPLITSQSEDLSKELLQLLFLSDPKDDVAAISREKGARHPGTCEWILQREEFKSWIESEDSSFWAITGSPGIGKTTLARFILEKLPDQTEPPTDHLLVYYFFDNKIEDRRTALTLVRSLVWQVMSQCKDTWRVMGSDWEAKGEKILNFDTLWRHLQSMIQSAGFSTIYILIDALDECDKLSRDVVLSALTHMAESVQTQGSTKIKALTTARPEMDIEGGLPSSWSRLRVDSGLVNVDLKAFIQSSVETMVTAKQIPEKTADLIQEALAKHADGTFLWASFVLRELARTPVYKIRKALEELPQGLYDVYCRILRRIAGENRNDAKVILTWITTASRPLKTTELALAFGTQTQHWVHPNWASDEEIAECSSVHLSCESLVYTDNKTGEVRLVHQTVKDFLVGPRLDTESDISDFRVVLEDANMSLFSTCWKYLAWPEFRAIFRRSPPWGPFWVEAFLNVTKSPQNSLLRYATMYLFAHLEAATEVVSDKFEWCDVGLLPKLSDRWLLNEVEDGHLDIVHKLLENGADIRFRDKEGDGVLHIAARTGDLAMARALLQSGANIDMKNHTGLTPVYLAAVLNNSNVFFLLLAHGAKAELHTIRRVCTGVPNYRYHFPADSEVFIQGDTTKPNVGFLKTHFFEEGRLTCSQALTILARARKILQGEANCLKLEYPIVVAGMVHGQYFNLLKLFETGGDPTETQYIFLGNYVNRGDFGCEVMLLLLALKIRHPTAFWLLRNRHECRNNTEYFSFKGECVYKYSSEVFESFLETFCALPLAAVVNKSVFCVAGGIGPDMITLQDIDMIDRFRETPLEGPMCDLLWAQNGQDFDISFPRDTYYIRNDIRESSYFYSWEAVRRFLDGNNLTRMVTSNDKLDAGYKASREVYAGRNAILNISSVPSFLGVYGINVYGNKGAVLSLSKTSQFIRQFESAPHPFYLPNFMDVFTWSLPVIGDRVRDMYAEILDKINSQGIKWILPKDEEKTSEDACNYNEAALVSESDSRTPAATNPDQTLEFNAANMSTFEKQLRSVFPRHSRLDRKVDLLQLLLSLSMAESSE
ncbi:hypothetical protein N8I77_011490 [Diaporthe amygdali]|uniref:Serine/threonine specific protein phosphatases domain-containing protein n=1 Tax=Phomopsis amygdali TaxID=1214568 RepID=A0AAD9W095_PHOAM|nr:hypothetical protein N8I77_011490 [Diaporthe amygdali]